MNKKVSVITSMILFSISTLSADIDIKPGWKLVGASQNINPTVFNNTCVDYVWKYDSSNPANSWKLHIANGKDYGNQVPPINQINKKEGFWIKGNDTCSIILDNIPTTLADTTITHNEIIYDAVTSPRTGRTWLDRNLGASQVCTAIDDTACYGDYYQWGRAIDGHEKIDSNTTLNSFPIYRTSQTVIVDHGYFINTSFHDWTTEDSDGLLRSNTWSKADGSSICPVGYRVPTMSELEAETGITGTYKVDDAYESFLKLPSASLRGTDGSFSETDTLFLWSSEKNNFIYFESSSGWSVKPKFIGNIGSPVRCIKN